MWAQHKVLGSSKVKGLVAVLASVCVWSAPSLAAAQSPASVGWRPLLAADCVPVISPDRQLPPHPTGGTRRVPQPEAGLRHLQAFLERGRRLMLKGPESRAAARRWLRLAHAVWLELEDPDKQDEARPLAAEALFLHGESWRQEFEEASFDDMDQIDVQVEAKTQLLESAELLYHSAIALEQAPWAARAALAVGLMNGEFAVGFSTLPFPEDIPTRYHEVLRAELVATAEPLRRRARTFFARALDLARRAGDGALEDEIRAAEARFGL